MYFKVTKIDTSKVLQKQKQLLKVNSEVDDEVEVPSKHFFYRKIKIFLSINSYHR